MESLDFIMRGDDLTPKSNPATILQDKIANYRYGEKSVPRL